jgi:hypothetical protein
LLALALDWQHHQHATHYLLVGQERLATEQWLLTHFATGEQPPCQPNALQNEFLSEARKNAENRLTDVFICYDRHDRVLRDQIVRELARYAITTWTHDKDIPTGSDYARAIEQGIETADNFLFLLSPTAVQSDYCQRELTHAHRYHKRIIPILIAPTPAENWPPTLRDLQYLHYSTDGIDTLLAILQQDQHY